jgi:hypothetical protein
MQMTLKFASGWDEARARYQDNQAYLDLFTEEQVSAAIWKSNGCGNNFQALINAAFKRDDKTVTVEQGPHQPENVQGGGFTLHVTPRFAGYAWHLYLSQDSSGGLHVEEWTTDDPNPWRRLRRYRFG